MASNSKKIFSPFLNSVELSIIDSLLQGICISLSYLPLSQNNPQNYIIDEGGGKATLDGFPGKITMNVYWMLPEKYDTKNLPSMSNITDKEMNGARLFIVITCETASQSYTVTNEYKLEYGSYVPTDETDKREKNTINKLVSDDLYNKNNKYYINSNEKWRWKFESRE